MSKLYNDKILKIFMLLQPVIDIITSIMINEYNLPISLGMIVRFIFLIYACGYIFLNKNKKIIIYSILWFIYISINIIGNCIIKDNFNIISHGILLIKMLYFSYILLFWVIYFKKNKEIDKRIFIYISLLVGLSLVVSCFTKTAYCTYSSYDNCYQKGVVAWFNSANEYGLILIILLGFSLIEFITKKDKINLLSLLINTIFLCVLGTKTSYSGIIGLLSLYVGYYLITCFFERKKSIYLYKVLFIILLVFVVGLSTSHLPIYTNLVSNYERAYSSATTDCEKYCENKTQEDIESEVKDIMIFNGRDDFVKINTEIYRNSPLFSKLFGITNQGNYYNGYLYTHINERDFHDLLIYYGIFGFFVEMLLPIYLFVGIIKKIIKKIKILWDDEIIILAFVIGLILFGSFLAGHCLFQPAVAIYLAYIVALFNKKVDEYK